MTSRILRRTLAATLLMGASPIAFAQNAASAPETDAPERLSTVIVSGVGPQRDTDEMIGNASVVTRDQIVETLQASLGNTLDSEPGVSTTHFGQAASRPVLRGLGAERVLVLTNGIGVIDASAASPDHQVASDGIDAEKIEQLHSQPLPHKVFGETIRATILQHSLHLPLQLGWLVQFALNGQ